LYGIGDDFRIDPLVATTEEHGHWYLSIQAGPDDIFVPHDDTLSSDAKSAQGIAL
jgi:hypothetical protein